MTLEKSPEFKTHFFGIVSYFQSLNQTFQSLKEFEEVFINFGGHKLQFRVRTLLLGVQKLQFGVRLRFQNALESY